MAQLENVLNLAHLKLSDGEKRAHLEQLQKILAHMDQLNRLDLTNILPSIHAVEMRAALRKDQIENRVPPFVETNAPAWSDGAFVVPKILGGA